MSKRYSYHRTEDGTRYRVVPITHDGRLVERKVGPGQQEWQGEGYVNESPSGDSWNVTANGEYVASFVESLDAAVELIHQTNHGETETDASVAYAALARMADAGQTDKLTELLATVIPTSTLVAAVEECADLEDVLREPSYRATLASLTVLRERMVEAGR